MLNKEAIKDDADILFVAESLGIQIHSRGRRNMILCPFHNDKKIGSCFIDNKGVTCYSCGARADVFALVSAVNDCSFSEAINYVAELCGGTEYYGSEEMDVGFIPPSAREIIGMEITPIYVPVEITSDYEYMQRLKADGLHISEQEDDDGTVYFVAERCADNNPLLSLYRADEESYRRIIDNQCQRRIDSLENILRFKGPLVRRLIDWVGEDCLAQAIRSQCTEIFTISGKYGDASVKVDRQLFTSCIANSLWESEDGAF